MRFYDFLVSGIPIPLTYKSKRELNKGDIYLLRVSGKKRIGILFNESKYLNKKKKDILEVEESDYMGFTFPESSLKLVEWMKDYYNTTYDKVISLFLPSSITYIEKTYFVIKQKREDIKDKEKEIFEYIKKRKKVSLKSLIIKFGASVRKIILNLEEKKIIERRYFIKRSIKNRVFMPEMMNLKIPERPTEKQREIIQAFFKNYKKNKIFLIHGVTGSGKTFIYREISKKILNEGKKVLILVPEISLIPQIAPYFKFEEYKLFIWGFILNADEKWNVIENTLKDEPCIVIGPRSAVFIPFKNLGLIVIDEEQEDSYKEKEREPFYHIRDIVMKRIEIENVPLIAGSATPSLEIYKDSKERGIYFYIPEKIKGYENPEIQVISLQNEPGRFYLTSELLESLEEAFKKNKKAILFLNRRGFAHFLQCRNCGFVPVCINCSISLTYYKKKNILLCHYCGWKEEPPDLCPKCKSFDIKISSYGTEKIEEELSGLFPDKKIARMDREAISGRKKVFEVFEKFMKGEIDILIGTQMVVKGLDNPLVGLACVLYADQDINFPDFRAREKMFSRLIQVAGRVRKKGKTIVQTFNPDDFIFEKIKKFDIRGFYEGELKERKKNNYPPFSSLTLIEVNTKIKEDGEEILFFVKKKIEESTKKVEILGPALAPIEKIKGFYRTRLLLRSSVRDEIKKVLSGLPENIKLKIDFNPYDFL